MCSLNLNKHWQIAFQKALNSTHPHQPSERTPFLPSPASSRCNHTHVFSQSESYKVMPLLPTFQFPNCWNK